MTINKSILLYDFLLVKGGAEAVTLDLCEHLPELDLGVCFMDEQLFPEPPVDSKRLHTLTGFTSIVGWQILKAALAFRHKAKWLSDYERIIYSGICSPLGIKHAKPDTANILYCHTPPRFIYDLKDYYLQDSGLVKGALIRLLSLYLKPRYEASIKQMDIVVANSKNVQGRLKKYLNVDSIVIYPPCHTERFQWIEQGDFYLSTARVENYKRVDKVVEAFIKMPDKKLVVASGGGDLQRLKAMAAGHDNIHFTGWCPESELKQLMGKCIATLYLPMDEDFGMSPVESMAAGKPVIGVAEGGVMETVVPDKTGVLCPANPTPDDIIEAVAKLTAEKALSMRPECQTRAEMFSCETFFSKMSRLLACNKSQLKTFEN